MKYMRKYFLESEDITERYQDAFVLIDMVIEKNDYLEYPMRVPVNRKLHGYLSKKFPERVYDIADNVVMILHKTDKNMENAKYIIVCSEMSYPCVDKIREKQYAFEVVIDEEIKEIVGGIIEAGSAYIEANERLIELQQKREKLLEKNSLTDDDIYGSVYKPLLKYRKDEVN